MDKQSVEQAYFDLSMRYQSDVGEPRRMILAAKALMDTFDWRSLDEPPELREVLALIAEAASRFNPQTPPDL